MFFVGDFSDVAYELQPPPLSPPERNRLTIALMMLK